jgi:surface polysaccharide O-acyltransferase-like enzyme
MDSKQGARNVSLDYLRIFATFAVIVLHTAKRAWYVADISSPDWSFVNFYDCAVRWAVPVFVMISGSLMAGREYTLKDLYGRKILRLVTCYIFWNALYLMIWTMEGASDWLLSKVLIEGNYHLWFIPMIIGLYIALPIITKITADRKVTSYFLIVSLVFSFLLPQMVNVIGKFDEAKGANFQTAYDNFHVFMFIGYAFYFILGFWLIRTTLTKTIKMLLLLAGAIGLFATVFLTSLMSARDGEVCDMFMDYMTVNVMLMSVGVFVLFTMIPGGKDNKFIRFLSKSCFGIYLVHEAFLIIMDKHLDFGVLTIPPLISVPAISIVVFILSMGVSMALNSIPVVKKYLV